MPEISNPIREDSRRLVGARLARAGIVLGFSGWLGCTLGNWMFNPTELLFDVSMISAALFGASVFLRGLQFVFPRRFPLWLKLFFTLFMMVFVLGLIFGLALIGSMPFPESPMNIKANGGN